MKIATFNANSIRVRQDAILDWLAQNDPDVLAIQETKVEDGKFPREAFDDAGYHLAFHGQKSYNGVAILSKSPMSNVKMGFGDPLWPEDCRILSATIDGVRIINTYVPNGTEVGVDKWFYKMNWLEHFVDFLQAEMAANSKLIWLGDINIAPADIDVHDHRRLLGQVGHHPDEFVRLEKIVSLGLTDVFRKFEPGPGHFTYWAMFVKSAFANNSGWRIDHIYAAGDLADQCTSSHIDKGPRGLERPSDHTYVVADFTL
jgi:exodeoxyribonuclease-3